METDKHYLRVGVFVFTTIALGVLFAMWLVGAYQAGQYKLYRIYFSESVSGLEVGSAVKFRGIPVGMVEKMAVDPGDMNRVRVDVNILETAPIKSDTFASLKLAGITGAIYIELTGGTLQSPNLASNDDSPSEIISQPSTLSTLMDQLPEILEKISHIADQADKLLSNKNVAAFGNTLGNLQNATKNANELTKELKENPTKLIFAPKKKKENQESEEKSRKYPSQSAR